MSEYYTKTHQISGTYSDYYYFGTGDVSIQGTRIYVGAPGFLGTSTLTSAVYVYDLNESTDQWSLTTTLSSDPETTDIVHFGNSVDVHDSQLVIAAGKKTGQYSSIPLVQIYEQQTSNTWSLTQTISTTDTNSTSGSDVSIYDDTLIVGDASFSSNKGRALVYTKSGSTWSLSTTVSASDGATNDFFGTSVSLDQNTLAVGARGDDDNDSTNSGSVYIFTRSGSSWTQTTKIHADDAAAYDDFGTSVGLSGTRLIVGSPGIYVEGNPRGAVYIFDKQSNGDWTQTTRISGDDVSLHRPSDGLYQFGTSVDTDGSRLVASGYIWLETGEVQVYTLSGGTTVSTAQATGDPHVVTFDGTRYTL